MALRPPVVSRMLDRFEGPQAGAGGLGLGLGLGLVDDLGA